MTQSMRSLRYIKDTYEAGTTTDAIRFTPVTMQCNPISIKHNAIRCNAENMINFNASRKLFMTMHRAKWEYPHP